MRRQPLIFICHSLGGLIVKQVLLDLDQQRKRRPEAASLLDQIRGIVFIATPHGGSRAATWLERLKHVVRPSEITTTLIANHAVLRKLNVSYRSLAEDRRDGLRHLVFYETHDTAIGSIADEGSSDPGLPGDPPIPIDADHLSIAKPCDRSSLVALRTEQFVRELVGPPPTPAYTSPGQLEVCSLPRLARPAWHRSLVPRLVSLALLLTTVLLVVRASLPALAGLRPARQTTIERALPPKKATVLAGEVLDAATNSPIVDVLVSLPAFNLDQRTSTQGRYRFDLPSTITSGSFVRLRARREGYQSLDEEFQVGADHMDVLVMERSK